VTVPCFKTTGVRNKERGRMGRRRRWGRSREEEGK